MQNITLVLILSMFFCISCVQKNYVVITNVDVFDGMVIKEGVNFVFRDSLIIAIDQTGKKYKNATLIDGRGKTIIPPLINAHVHIASPENLKEALQVGIFGMMDMFTVDRRAIYLRSFNDSTNYAHYYSSHIGATAPNGHGTQYGVKIPTINDSLSPAAFVKERIRLGADYLKITQEHTMAKLNSAQLSELISEAHRHHKIVVAHVSELNDAIELVNSDIDGLAHIWYRENVFASEIELNKLKNNNTFIIPTLSVIEKAIAYAAETRSDTSMMPFEKVLQEVNKAYQKGIPILAGTDARNFNMNYTTQYFEEFKLLSQSGMSNIDVLKAGTSNIYKAFQLKEFNNLTRHSLANFILIEGKPQLKIEDIRNKKRIWKKGIEIVFS